MTEPSSYVSEVCKLSTKTGDAWTLSVRQRLFQDPWEGPAPATVQKAVHELLPNSVQRKRKYCIAGVSGFYDKPTLQKNSSHHQGPVRYLQITAQELQRLLSNEMLCELLQISVPASQQSNGRQTLKLPPRASSSSEDRSPPQPQTGAAPMPKKKRTILIENELCQIARNLDSGYWTLSLRERIYEAPWEKPLSPPVRLRIMKFMPQELREFAAYPGGALKGVIRFYPMERGHIALIIGNNTLSGLLHLPEYVKNLASTFSTDPEKLPSTPKRGRPWPGHDTRLRAGEVVEAYNEYAHSARFGNGDFHRK